VRAGVPQGAVTSSTLFNFYLANRLNPTVSVTCPDCNTAPHSVAHLSECPMHQTNLTPVDLWQRPKEVAEFLNA